jgi:hypothetical protein
MHVKQFFLFATFLFLIFQVSGQSLKWKQKILLDMELEEMSGLVVYDTIGYTINDSGGKACLYGLSLTTGQILSRHYLDGIKNYDFEALTQSSTHFFVGDMGNNFANRASFQIHALEKKDIGSQSHPKFNTLNFTLPNYTSGWRKKHDFDMESLIVNSTEDSLIIFSKNRASNSVQVYGLKIAFSDSIQTAKSLGQFQLQGMVTAASYYGNDLFILTYYLWNTFLYKIPNFKYTPISKWMPIEIKVKGKGYQREALWFENGVVYIGSERTRSQTQCIDKFVFK